MSKTSRDEKPRPTKFSNELLAAASQYALLRELLEFMTPLYIVALGSASETNVHYIAVPPDNALEDFIVGHNVNLDTSGASDSSTVSVSKRSRVVQAVVRSHIFRSNGGDQFLSLGGHSANVTWNSEDQQQHEGGLALGTLNVRTPQGHLITAVVHRVLTCDNPHFTFLFVDTCLHQTSSMARRSVASIKIYGIGGHQPLWQRIPCSAAKVIRAAQNTNDSLSQTNISTSELLQLFKSDEQSFRHFVVDFAIEREDEIQLRRLSLCPDTDKAGIGSSPSTALTASHSAADTQHLTALQGNIDRAMMFTDTEVAMFLSAYVVMPGFEGFAVSKVHQMIETATEIALGESLDGGDDGNTLVLGDDCSVACLPADECAEAELVWTEEDHEQLVVAFHTIIGGSLAVKLVPHWEEIYYNEDFAFHHACCMLHRKAVLEELSTGIALLTSEQCSQVSRLVCALDDRSLSVFSYMRIMESVVNASIDLLTRASKGTSCEVTADICIPLIVIVLVHAAPSYLPSRIKYLLDLSIPVLEMSSLGYALTTFEAAAEQLLEEYRQRVVVNR